MHEEYTINQIVTAAVTAALGVVFPILFHVLGLGSIFLPMFIPLAVGSFFLSHRFAFFIGVITPLASAILTGMPPFYPPIAIVMLVELSVFCLIISLLTHYRKFHPLVIIITALLVDRLLLYALMAFVMPAFGISVAVYTIFDLAKSLPGVILIAIIAPIAVRRIEKILKGHPCNDTQQL